MSYYGFRPYVPVAKRRAQAEKEAAKLAKKGTVLRPIKIEGRKIADSFWGKSWCDNLERYSDYENRLPRGRTYVRNGSVIDLKIERGKVEAMVSGSEIYKVVIDISVAASARWKAICADCAGSVGSLVELLQGKLSKNVMERVCREKDGLFPAPPEIKMSCSCPDSARMCKHVAATLYGVGARLDSDPDLLFALRGVDRAELVTDVANLPMARTAATSERVLADDDMSALFGLEIEAPVAKLKPVAEPKKRAREVAPPPAAAAPNTPARKTAKAVAKTKPPVPKAEPKRSVAAPVSAKRRKEEQPAGRTRAAKWIGAQAKKAAR